jgi:hypothetical protein
MQASSPSGGSQTTTKIKIPAKLEQQVKKKSEMVV